LLHIAPVGFVAAIGKSSGSRGSSRPQSPSAVTYVSYRDLGVGGEHTRDGVYRPDQAELSVAECSEVPAITLVEFYVCQVARPQSHLVDHVGEDIDGSDQADEWRQG